MVKILDDLKLWPYDAAQVKSVNYKNPQETELRANTVNAAGWVKLDWLSEINNTQTNNSKVEHNCNTNFFALFWFLSISRNFPTSKCYDSTS